jgi:predicted GNAT family N-acyltransferase
MNGEITVRPPSNEQELLDALALRQEIFIVEEGRARFVDADEFDPICDHIVAMIGGEVVGTLRLYLLHPGDRAAKIGRVAVRKDLRGLGIGSKMMAAAHEFAATKYEGVYLHAQIGVVDFYKKLGYVTEGDVFVEAGTPHVLMRLLQKEFLQPA